MNQELQILRSHRIAIDYVLWAAGRGLSPAAALAGLEMAWPGSNAPSWDDAVLAIAIAHRRLTRGPEIVVLRRAA